MPSSRCSDLSRSRICAWIVTSSAVVGSSAISRSGLARERHRDHHALPHAARQLVRIRVDALLGRRDADELEHLDRDLARLAPRLALVQPHRLADLIADGEHRVERRHRLLEDHRDPVAADRAHLGGRQREQILAAVLDRARRRSGPGGDAISRMIDSAVTLLPQPDSPTTPSVAARRDLERHAIDRAHRAVLGAELRHQVADPSSMWTRGYLTSTVQCPRWTQ